MILFLLALFSIVGQTPPPTTTATPPVCKVVEVAKIPGFALLTSEEKGGLERYRVRECDRVQSGASTERQLTKALFNGVLLFGACNDDHRPSQDYLAQYTDKPEFRAMRIATREFCANRWTLSGADWFRAETFCIVSRSAVDPAGWRQLVRPRTPNWAALEKKTADLCAQAHAGKIELRDAYYQWRQDMNWTMERLPQEWAAQTGAAAKSLATLPIKGLEELLDLAGKVVPLIPLIP